MSIVRPDFLSLSHLLTDKIILGGDLDSRCYFTVTLILNYAPKKGEVNINRLLAKIDGAGQL